MHKDQTNRISQEGFTLVEVMIAMTIFALFITAFLMSQGSNISSSVNMQEDIIMQGLAQQKINEIMIDKPVFSNATDKQVESKNFEEEEFKHYKYTIEFKRLVFPDFQQLTGQSEDEEENQNADANQNQNLRKAVFDKLKKNMEEILWQVRVTITNTDIDYEYSLSSWITNDRAQIDTNFIGQ